MNDVIAEARKLLAGEAQRLGKFLSADKTRARAPAVRKLHEIRRMLDQNYAYTSQAGQDTIVDQLMKLKRGGTFVDVGGYDGVTGSNTLFLEAYRGWTGALIEPVPAQLEKAKVARTCPCLGVAIAPTEGEADFIEISEGYTQMSGLASTYDAKLLDTVRADSRHKENVLRVQTKTLSMILVETGLTNPDFLSLDIEGGEVACLESFPFADHDVKIWSIENNTSGSEIRNIMEAAGYRLIEFCGPDEIYAKPG
ncbi:MAG: FkbM family methyltransferase [Pseudomonadota bacterium]